MTDESWRAGPARRPRGRPLRRPDHRRRAAIRGLAPAGGEAADRPGGPLASFMPVRTLDFDLTTLQPYVGPPTTRQDVAHADPDLDLAVRADAGRLRAEPGRLAAVHRARPARKRDPDPARGGARARRARHPSAARRRGHRPVRPQRRRRLLRAHQDLPRLPLRRGHRLARRAARRTTSRRSSSTPTWRAPGSSSAPTRRSTSCTANVVWGTKGNFLDLPTDCPQRDERLGWTGDIAAFAPSAAYLFDVETFLADWLLDLAAEQRHARRHRAVRRPRRPEVPAQARGVP